MKIEEGIPVPYFGRVDGEKYPFKKMKVGDSFLIPETINHLNVRYGFYSFRQRNNLKDRKFVIRKTNEGYRCWRVK